MRIFSAPLKDMVEVTAAQLDATGILPEPPPELGGANLTELLNDKKVRVSVDPKYPQAIGINQILSNTAIFCNSRWEVLYNDIIDSPFFTSDYPIAIEETTDPHILNKIIPLSPKIAIRICPNPSFEKEVPDFTFSGFAYCIRTPNRKEVFKVNELIVRSAENMVFYRDNHNWVRRFVANNSAFRIEPYSRKIKSNKGTFMLFTQRIAKIGKAK